jgi:hypothetical protein
MLEDPVAGSRMFWATRPIAGLRLLTAKALTVALVFVLWPVVINCLWGLATDIGPAELIPSLLRTGWLQLMVTVPAMAIAALSGSPGRAFAWSFLALVAIPIVGGNVPRLFSDDAHATRNWIVLSCLAVGTVGALLWQFVSRRLVVSVTWILTSIALALGALFFWRWGYKSPRLENSDGAPQVTVRQISIEPFKEQITVGMLLAMTPLPLDVAVENVVVRAELTWPDGDKSYATGRIEGWPGNRRATYRALGLPDKPFTDAETEAHQQEPRRMRPDLYRKDAVPEEGGVCNMFFTLPMAEMARLLGSPPRCRVWLDGEKLRAKLIGEVPLRTGARIVGEGFHVAVQSLTDTRKTAGGFVTRQCMLTSSQPAARGPDSLAVEVLDRQRGRAAWTANSGRSVPVVLQLGLPATYMMRWIELPAQRVWRKDREVEMAEQYEDYTVAAVALRPAGRWTQSFEIERLAVTK